MSVRFKWPPDLAAFRFGSALIWALRGGGIPATVTGISPLSLINAIAKPITKLLQHGKVAVSGTDVICNNGTLKFGASGTNLLDMSKENIRLRYYINDSGVESSNNQNFYNAKFIPVKPNTAYTLSVNTPVYYTSIMEYDSNKGFLQRTLDGSSSEKHASMTLTTRADTAYILIGSNPNRVTIYIDDVTSIDWMLNEGSAALPYEPYTEGIYADGTPEVITLSAAGAEDQTAHAENLFAVGDIEDTQDIISGTVTRRTEAVVSDGTTPSGRYVGTVGEGNIIVKVREDGYTGDIVSFETEEEKPLNGLVVEMEPQQDLHGQDTPYPAGGGKNKLDAASTFTNPTASLVIKTLTLKPNTQYTASTNHPIGSRTTAATLLADMTETLSTGTCGFWNGTSRTKTTDENGQLRIAYRLVDSETAAAFLAYNYQLEEGSSATSFAPYENICPISGWTGCEVTRTGKNLLDPVKRENRLQNIYFYREMGFQLKGGKTYTFSISGENAAGIYISKYSEVTNLAVKYNTTALTFTPEEDVMCYFNVYYSPNPPSGGTDSIKCQLELSAAATDYEEYKGNSYSVTFPSVNIWDEEYKIGYWDAGDGHYTPVGAEICSKDYIPVLPETTYRGVGFKQNSSLVYYDENKGYLGWSRPTGTFTTPANAKFITLNLGSPYGTEYHNDCSVNYPPTITDYYAYGEPLTVYGGTPDIIGGGMPVTWEYSDMGARGWISTTYQGVTMMVTSISAKSRDSGTPIPALCSMYEASDNIWSASTLRDKLFSINYAGNLLYVYDSDYTDAASFKTAMSGVQLVYELATPIEIQLPPQVVETLRELNNIWSNAGAVAVYVPTGDLIEKVTPQKLSTAEGDNTITVTAEVEDIVFDVIYSENNPGE